MILLVFSLLVVYLYSTDEIMIRKKIKNMYKLSIFLQSVKVSLLKELIFAQSLISLVKRKIQTINHMQKQMGGQSLSPSEKTIVAIHALNIFNKLQCINDKYQTCQFPQNWRSKEKDQYFFRYNLHKERGLMRFKFTPQEHKLVIIFGYENSKQVNRVQLDNNLSMQEIVKKYQFNLHQFLTTQVPQSQKPFYHSSHEEPKQSTHSTKQKQHTHPIKQKQSSQPRNQPHDFIQKATQSYPPKNVFSSPQATNPFGQEEYVGPKSEAFHNPYFQQTKVPSSKKVPPGARYDPVDPFDDPFKEKKEGPGEFVGFDQFGKPIDPSKQQGKPKQLKPLPKESKPGFDLGNKPGGFGGKQPKI